MKYVRLGTSRLEVSSICLGTMNFGKFVTPEESHAIMDAALDQGINFFDTANTYGAPGEPSYSERIIGDWFAKGGGRREKVVLATKLFENTESWPNNGGLSALNIRRACEASLKRLKTDHIDLLQMHHIDRGAGWEEIWEAYEVLRHQGKVVYAGSSNFAGWHIAVAQGAARDRHFLGLISEQSLYNLSQRIVELEVLPSAIHHGLGLIPWSPLASGLLSAPLESETRSRTSDPRVLARLEENRVALQSHRELAAELGCTPAQMSIAWLLTRKGVAAPIIGPRTKQQMLDLVAAADVALEPGTLTRLDTMWPGPKGAAPEAYAW